jgi:D-alanyl-D-alanine carboxypeptidase (penicillin-binding protein 5/6)
LAITRIIINNIDLSILNFIESKIEGMGVIVKKTVFIIGTVLVVGLGAIFGTMLIKTIQYTIEESAEKDLEKSQDLSYKEINQILQDKANSDSKKELDQDINERNKTAKETSDIENSTLESNKDKTEEKENESEKSSWEPIDKSIEDGYYSNADGLDPSEWEEPSVEVNSSPKMALNIKNPSISIDAKSAILIDSKNGKVLYHKNATEPVYPASTTKLMTALVILELCDLNDTVKVGQEIQLIAPDSSRAYLQEGEKLTVQMLLEGMLLPSGNDAAYTLAAHGGRIILKDKSADAKKAVKAFVNKMNEKVKELGLKDTHFKNPDGYDTEGQYTTAYDMGIISLKAIKKDIIREITEKDKARNIFLSGEDVTWKSTNKLVVNGSGVFYKYAIGLKTGSSSLAGSCLVSAAEDEDKQFISVIMNSTASGRWEDSITLLKYGMEH